MRGAKREVISRGYNLLLRGTLATRLSDAQCGFKAIRADVAARLLPLVEDTGWFFDTELLVLAERGGLRIHEVPVDWIDDPDSRVDIVRTARADLAGIARMLRALTTGRLPVAELRASLGRGPLTDPVPGVPAGLVGQLVRFAPIGVLSTRGLPGAVRRCCAAWSAPSAANLVALLLTAVANTAANRRITFGIRGGRRRRPGAAAGPGRVRPRAGADQRLAGRPARGRRPPARGTRGAAAGRRQRAGRPCSASCSSAAGCSAPPAAPHRAAPADRPDPAVPAMETVR